MISRTAVPRSMRPSDGVCIVGSRRLVEGWVNSNLAYVGHFYIGDDKTKVVPARRDMHGLTQGRLDPIRDLLAGPFPVVVWW